MDYKPPGYDEMFASEGEPRGVCREFVERLQRIPDHELRARQTAAELNLHNMGITYYNLAMYDAALPYHTQALAMWRALFDGNHPAVVKSLLEFDRTNK